MQHAIYADRSEMDIGCCSSLCGGSGGGGEGGYFDAALNMQSTLSTKSAKRRKTTGHVAFYKALQAYIFGLTMQHSLRSAHLHALCHCAVDFFSPLHNSITPSDAVQCIISEL
jgi:hypothetical protein